MWRQLAHEPDGRGDAAELPEQLQVVHTAVPTGRCDDPDDGPVSCAAASSTDQAGGQRRADVRERGIWARLSSSYRSGTRHRVRIKFQRVVRSAAYGGTMT